MTASTRRPSRCTPSPSARRRCTTPGARRTPGSGRSTGENPLYVPGAVWEALGFEDGDWADVVSPHGRITVPVARMDALNPHTVWTWNAIGKRPGAWALAPDAPEATRGFLLNHLIPELLPGDGHARTPTRSPARPPGTTSASASSASPPAPAPRPGSAADVAGRRPLTLISA